MNGARQLPLDLGVPPRYGAEDFLVSDCNEAAYDFLERWPNWPGRTVLLTGPEGAGKTHLSAIFAKRAGGLIIPATQLTVASVPALAAMPALALEGIDGGIDEAALFHLLNLAQEGRTSVLMTASQGLGGWEIATADLKSRLRLATPLTIEPPDDALLRALLVKLFVDRQLVVDIQVVDFLALRIERSFAGARAVVEMLDRETLARGRRITRAMAGEILAQIEEAGGNAG